MLFKAINIMIIRCHKMYPSARSPHTDLYFSNQQYFIATSHHVVVIILSHFNKVGLGLGCLRWKFKYRIQSRLTSSYRSLFRVY